MLEEILLVLVLVFFILAFGVRNISTYLATKKSIRGNSLKLTLSILFSTIIYLLLVLRLTILDSYWLVELERPLLPTYNLIGYGLIACGFIIGLLSLATMKNSWRVGIRYDQQTALITTGIYRFSRNPYFFSYNILILGYILLYPSLILLGLLIALAIVFHKMIREEEAYLEAVHGQQYLDYKQQVNRYFTLRKRIA